MWTSTRHFESDTERRVVTDAEAALREAREGFKSPTLRLEILAVHYPYWDMARIGPQGLERVMQSDKLADGIATMLESTLTAAFPENTRIRLVVELEIPQGGSSSATT